jgi:hypothetical protein
MTTGGGAAPSAALGPADSAGRGRGASSSSSGSMIGATISAGSDSVNALPSPAST